MIITDYDDYYSDKSINGNLFLMQSRVVWLGEICGTKKKDRGTWRIEAMRISWIDVLRFQSFNPLYQKLSFVIFYDEDDQREDHPSLFCSCCMWWSAAATSSSSASEGENRVAASANIPFHILLSLSLSFIFRKSSYPVPWSPCSWFSFLNCVTEFQGRERERDKCLRKTHRNFDSLDLFPFSPNDDDDDHDVF